MLRLEHVGVAVKDVEAVIDCFQELLGARPYKAETVTDQQVRTHFLNGKSAKLELLEALGPDSPVQKFLDNQGEGLHHLAFEVEDATATMARLREADFTLLSETPQSGADEKQIFFVHPKETHGVLVEFCESTASDWSPTRVPHRDGQLGVYERGRRDRPSVLLLHGAAGSTRAETAPLMRRLEPSFHVIGVDLSGHGASSLPPDDTLTLERFAQDALAGLDAVDVSSAHVFGFSLGASVALQAAHTAPNRVDRLALLSPNLVWTEALADAMNTRLNLETLRERDPGRADALLNQHEHPDRLFPALRSFIARLPEKSETAMNTLGTVAHPTLVTALDEDPLFPLDGAQSLHRQLPHARLSVIPGSQHSLRTVPLSVLTTLLQHHYAGE